MASAQRSRSGPMRTLSKVAALAVLLFISFASTALSLEDASVPTEAYILGQITATYVVVIKGSQDGAVNDR